MSVELFEHQKEALDKAEGLNKVAFYHDMGLGKTYTGAEKLVRLGAKVNLVVCQKSKVDDWYSHFVENYEDLLVLNLTNSTDLKMFIIENDMRCESYSQAVGVINYDLLWRRPALKQLKDFTLMLDESSLIQNTTKRTKFIMSLKPANVILLSGTPTGGKYEKLWTQLKLLGWNITKKMYWSQFVEVEYLDLVDRSIPIVKGYKRVERLKSKMAQYGCQFLTTDEVYDMPKQTFTKIKVEPSKEYKHFRKHGIVKIGGYYKVDRGQSFKDNSELVGEETLVGDTTLTKILYERMLCGAYSKEKLKAFTDLLESTEDRLVVFYNFKAELEKLMKIAGQLKRQFGVVNGDVKNPEIINAKGAILFVQYQAGAMGLNLQKANKIIYYSLPLSSELYEQSKKRIHRIGQNKPCFYYQLIVKGSIEEKILRTLNKRQDYTAKLFEKDD